MLTNEQMQVHIMWQHVLVVLQNILNRTQDFIMQNNKNIQLHKQLIMLNDLYGEAREMRSKMVDKAIDEGDIEEMLSEVTKAGNELKKIVSLSISMQSYVYVSWVLISIFGIYRFIICRKDTVKETEKGTEDETEKETEEETV